MQRIELSLAQSAKPRGVSALQSNERCLYPRDWQKLTQVRNNIKELHKIRNGIDKDINKMTEDIERLERNLEKTESLISDNLHSMVSNHVQRLRW
mmetsp:Transcript_6758/g.7385  ORF Transcript_6758/g.7385 Transcript_6758/m.7385 type:complete len:95 (-) Transcript_6758:430-714(-)